MRSRILKCPQCRTYTLKQSCPKCGTPTENTFPPKYSPYDRYGGYRRKAIYQELAGAKEEKDGGER